MAENAARMPSILEKIEAMTMQEKIDLDTIDCVLEAQVERLMVIVHGKSALTKELETGEKKDHPYLENRAGKIECDLDDMRDSIKSLSLRSTALTNLLDLLDGPQTIKKPG